jgi:hypothetical protein
MVLGSLRDQLIYPEVSTGEYNETRDRKLKSILQMVDLEHLITRAGDLNTVVTWEDVSTLYITILLIYKDPFCGRTTENCYGKTLLSPAKICDLRRMYKCFECGARREVL